MFLRLPCMLVLSFDLIVSATPFQPTVDNTSELSATPNIIGPVTLSNASIPPLDASEENGLNIRCDGETYGYNPNIVDCEDAKEYLLPDTKTWTFGERHTDLPADILPLPYRVMGDRGLCYIQTVLVRDHKTGKATLSMLRRAATALVVQCATSVVSQGGIATNIGKEPPRSLTIHSSPTWLPDCMGKLIDSGGDHNLAVILGIYQVPLSCRGTFSSWDSCRDILYDMPAGKKPGVFGPRGDPAVTEELPYNIESSDRKCSANLFSTGKSDVSSFYEIWEAATAVFSVCVRHGKAGSVRALGEHGNIFITMTTNERLALPSNSTRGASS